MIGAIVRGFGVALFAAATTLALPAWSADIELSKLETKDVRILYYDPIQTYLTPYIARSFENSLAFQEQLFGWQPWDKTTIYLRDLSDDGMAVASSTPDNQLTIDIAPISTVVRDLQPRRALLHADEP